MTAIVKVIGTPIAPFQWPMNVYPNFSNNTGDFYVNEALSDPDIVAVTLPSLYSSGDVDFNISFEGVEQDTTVSNVTLITPPSSEPGLTLSRVNATTYRVIGSVSPAVGEYFNFLMRDKTYKALPVDTSEDWIAVVKWNPASQPWESLKTYTFSVQYTYTSQDLMMSVNATESITINQYAYWFWEPSLQSLQQLVQEGEI